MKSVFTGTRRLLKEYRKKLPFLFILAIIEGVLSCFGISLFLPTIEFFVYEGKANSKYGEMIFSILQGIGINTNIISFSAFIIIIFLIKAIVSLVQRLITNKIGTRLYNDLRHDLVNSTLEVDYNYFTSLKAGSVCNAIQKESKKAVASVSYFMEFSVAAIYVFCYMSVAVMISWKMTVAFFAIVCVVAYFFQKINISSLKKGKEDVRLGNVINSQIIDVVNNIKYLKMISTEGKMFESLRDDINKFSQNIYKISRNNALVSVPSELIGIIAFFLILMLGLYLKVNIEGIVVAALLFQRVYTKINDFFRCTQVYLSVLPGFIWVLDLRENLRAHKEMKGHSDIDEISTIAFSNVSFSYDKEKDVLYPTDMTFDKKKMTAIIGPSGSGKSTIVNLLCGLLRQDHGNIYIDGKSLTEVNRDSYKRLIGYVPQEPFLFNDTIRNNITLKCEGFSEDEIIKVSRTANAHDFISRFPGKYDEVIGDRGIRMSGGERQRIVIARELLRAPQLLILDEATNALDAETENKIQQTIDDLAGKITVVVIAHRLSTIRKADRIYVIEDGRIVESGVFNQLLERCERFKDLYSIQMV